MTEERKQYLIAFAKKLKVTFNDINLLNIALTHTSYAHEKDRQIPSNERLEFLGDAVLELASSTYLYEHFKDLSEGELTKTRASVVCQDTLSRLAKKLGIGEMLLLGRGEEASGGRKRVSTLEDTFEAVIGAIYLDQGWQSACDYVLRQLSNEFESASHESYRSDYKTTLQEIVQQNPSSKINYVELSVDGPDHMPRYEFGVQINGKLYGKGIGKTKKSAEQMAAKETLNILNAN